MRNPAAVLIAGPTASGKSARALAMARTHGGTVINADSMQVYRDLSVLTARPADDEVAAAAVDGIAYRLYGHIDGVHDYSVGHWLTEAAREITAAHDDARTPVFVGGTGLYFTALLNGLSAIPEIPAEIRQRLRTCGGTGAELHSELAARDPVMAVRLNPSDRQRVIRALEVIEATGRSLAEWQSRPGKPLLDAEKCHRIVVSPDREVLYARCDARFDTMMNTGVLEEVRTLIARSLSRDRPVMRALGVKHLAAMLAGTLSRDDAIALAKTATRQFAKRQHTWTRNQMAEWEWCGH